MLFIIIVIGGLTFSIIYGIYYNSNNYNNGFDNYLQNLIENIEIFEVSSSFIMEIMKETTNIPILNEL